MPKEERELVESTFELGESQVRELMTPRPLIDWSRLSARIFVLPSL